MFLPQRDRESRETSMEADRNRAIEAVRNQLHNDAMSAAGPSASVGPRAPGLGRPVPENLAQANEVLEQTRQLRGKPDLSRDDVEKEAKSLLAEFLNNENEKVTNQTNKQLQWGSVNRTSTVFEWLSFVRFSNG